MYILHFTVVQPSYNTTWYLFKEGCKEITLSGNKMNGYSKVTYIFCPRVHHGMSQWLSKMETTYFIKFYSLRCRKHFWSMGARCLTFLPVIWVFPHVLCFSSPVCVPPVCAVSGHTSAACSEGSAGLEKVCRVFLSKPYADAQCKGMLFLGICYVHLFFVKDTGLLTWHITFYKMVQYCNCNTLHIAYSASSINMGIENTTMASKLVAWLEEY